MPSLLQQFVPLKAEVAYGSRKLLLTTSTRKAKLLKYIKCASAAISLASLAACGGGGGDDGATGLTREYTLSGTVTGLENSKQVTLLNNAGDATSVSANGNFSFTTPVAYNGSYVVTVGTQPTGQTCTVSNGSGAGVVANVSNVAVTCSDFTYAVSGSVNGLDSGKQVTLLNNAGDATSVSANGNFSFTTPVAYNGSYVVTVGTQPTGQTCTVSNGSGAGVVANVSNVAVTCSDVTTATATVSTFAGSGQQGSVDGTGTAAGFNYPYGIGIDSSGNLFVADFASSLIRKITPEGVVSTFAGGAGFTGFGFTDGTGTGASFSSPEGVAVDSSGNVFVSDWGNSAIRKITSAGVVSTFATFADGINSPVGVAVDSSGNVFVVDSWNHAIRKITPSGLVSTFAGGSVGFTDGSGIEARFYNPRGIAIDSNDNVFVADASNNSIRKITPTGIVTTLAGSALWGFVNGSGAAARFSYPTGVSVDGSGNVFVADHDNHAVRKVTSEGVVSTLAGGSEYGFENGTGDVAKFKQPRDVAVDAGGNVFVTDSGNQVIRKIIP